jgi:hypothetical protein
MLPSQIHCASPIYVVSKKGFLSKIIQGNTNQRSLAWADSPGCHDQSGKEGDLWSGEQASTKAAK